MADVDVEVTKKLWYQTPDYSWDSLYRGLDNILSQNIISRQAYNDLRWAINKLVDLGANFPSSYYELHQRLDHYL